MTYRSSREAAPAQQRSLRAARDSFGCIPAGGGGAPARANGGRLEEGGGNLDSTTRKKGRWGGAKGGMVVAGVGWGDLDWRKKRGRAEPSRDVTAETSLAAALSV